MAAVLTQCHFCGALSKDAEWCSNCGSHLGAPIKKPRIEWLTADIAIPFTLGVLPIWDDRAPQRLLDTGGFSRCAVVTRPMNAPTAELEAIALDETPPHTEAVEILLQETVDPFELIGGEEITESAVGTPERPVEVVDPFELIGGDAPEDTDDAETSAQPLPSLAELDASSTEEHGRERTVIVSKELASFSKRRLWEAIDQENGFRYLLEERQLATSEDADAAVVLDGRDALSKQFLFSALARKRHEDRVLTLYEAPCGLNLKEWREEVGHAGATPAAILERLEVVFVAFEAIHAESHVLLQLSPENIWFTEKRGVVFSEVHAFEPMPVEKTRFRARPGFSAPELFGHGKHTVDARADVYSLGALAYFLVSGRTPPVAPETAFAPALAPRDFRPSFPLGWSDIILVATAPAPLHRFADVGEFREALRDGFSLMERRVRMTGPLNYHAVAEKHIGYAKQLRSPVNQDNVFVGHNAARDRLLVVVADGVSTATYGSGDLASGFVAHRAEEMWAEIERGEGPREPQEIIETLIIRANADISDYVNEKYGPLRAPPSEVMGSTVLAAYITRGEMTLASLGDSRCYLIREETMECLTRDHSLFALSLIEGLALQDVMMMPHGDALARCLGTFDVTIDGVLIPQPPTCDIYRLKLMPDDNVLLCTDGLFDYAGESYEESEENIRQRVLIEEHPGIACLELIVLANRGGGGDNIGAAIIKVSSGRDFGSL